MPIYASAPKKKEFWVQKEVLGKKILFLDSRKKCSWFKKKYFFNSREKLSWLKKLDSRNFKISTPFQFEAEIVVVVAKGGSEA